MKKSKLESEEIAQENVRADLSYSKKELISSKKYLKNRDILNVLLKDGGLYTYQEVDKLLENFRKGKV